MEISANQVFAQFLTAGSIPGHNNDWSSDYTIVIQVIYIRRDSDDVCGACYFHVFCKKVC